MNLTLSFESSRIRKLGQKFKYLENEKSFSDEVKSIFVHFKKAFIEAYKTIFSGRRVQL